MLNCFRSKIICIYFIFYKCKNKKKNGRKYYHSRIKKYGGIDLEIGFKYLISILFILFYYFVKYKKYLFI